MLARREGGTTNSGQSEGASRNVHTKKTGYLIFFKFCFILKQMRSVLSTRKLHGCEPLSVTNTKATLLAVHMTRNLIPLPIPFLCMYVYMYFFSRCFRSLYYPLNGAKMNLKLES